MRFDSLVCTSLIILLLYLQYSIRVENTVKTEKMIVYHKKDQLPFDRLVPLKMTGTHSTDDAIVDDMNFKHYYASYRMARHYNREDSLPVYGRNIVALGKSRNQKGTRSIRFYIIRIIIA